MSDQPDVIYTWTDEAPMLATRSLLPIVEGFTRAAGVSIGTADISLAGRILAAFELADDDLAALGALTRSPSATIIKLPNISASLPQLKAAIRELRDQGVSLPDYPDSVTTDLQRRVRARYDAVKGSAVNPVLREGNSDRRAPAAVKAYARTHPHSMGEWSPDSRTRVMTMDSGDFRHNERSVIVPEAGTLRIQLVPSDGSGVQVLRESLPVTAGEVVDGTFMSATALDAFLAEAVAAAKDDDVLLSVHLKATMMKVSDPLIFGHAVRAALPRTFAAYGEAMSAAGLRAEDGLASILAGLDALAQGEEIRASIEAELAAGPRLSMVDSDRGVTNLHVPSDVIIDASMPAMIRNGGKLWDADGKKADTLAVIPDSSYAGVYEAVIEDCKTHGALDPRTMGTVPNVGLMARRAEEYGSHDKTFLVPVAGRVEVVVVDGAGTAPGTVLLSDDVEAGDIWRACQTQDAPVRDWVHLAVTRARATGAPAIFWLDPERGHDRVIAELVERYLAEEDVRGLDIRILDPVAATRLSLEAHAPAADRGLPALGLPRRIPGPGRGPAARDGGQWERAGRSARRRPGRRDDETAGGQSLPRPSPGRDRQPRLARLAGAVLGPRPRGAGHRRRARDPLRPGGPIPGGGQRDGAGRARRRAGPPGRTRRLLPARGRQGGRRHEAEPDPQRHYRRAVGLGRPTAAHLRECGCE